MTDYTQDILRIKQKLKERKIELNEPVSIEVFQKIGAEYGITLSIELVLFYTQISNGLELGVSKWQILLTIETIKKRYINPETIRLKFPFSESWDWEEEPNNDLTDTTYHGNITLVDEDDGREWNIIVTGDEKGQMWRCTNASTQPCEPRQNFLSWFEIWLDTDGDYYSEIGRMVEGTLIRNIQSYQAEKYTTDTENYIFVEEGIWLFKNMYDSLYVDDNGCVWYVYDGGSNESTQIQSAEFVTTLSFEQDTNERTKKEIGICPQYPLEDILDKFSVAARSYPELGYQNGTSVCYVEFFSDDIEDIRNLRENIIGKQIYNKNIKENGSIGIELVVE